MKRIGVQYMPEDYITSEQIRAIINSVVENPQLCGCEAFVVNRNSPKLRKMNMSNKIDDTFKSFRTYIKEMFFGILQEQYLSDEADYVDGRNLADDQNKFYIIKQSESYYPFSFLNTIEVSQDFEEENLTDSTALVFQFRKNEQVIWVYQQLWSVMVPNKKKNSIVARITKMENQTVFSKQEESLLTIANKIDMLIIGDYIITKNINLLQKYYGFQEYIFQTAQKTVDNIERTDLVENPEKLKEYISRGKTRYAKKMMRIESSRVFLLNKEQLLLKVNTIPRWQGKFEIDPETDKIRLKSYKEVEDLIDLFDERYTRSEVTDTEYDTDVKTIAQPIN